jgi:hypothetical protein
MNVIDWLSEPINKRQAIVLWSISFLLVIFFWLFVPVIFMGVPARAITLAIEPSLHNLTVINSVSFGEELTFRVLPVVTVLYFFPNRTKTAYAFAVIAAHYFGIVHERMLTENIALGLGGLVLVVVYLKFGGGYGKWQNGFLACGSIHAITNILVSATAHLIVSL